MTSLHYDDSIEILSSQRAPISQAAAVDVGLGLMAATNAVPSVSAGRPNTARRKETRVNRPNFKPGNGSSSSKAMLTDSKSMKEKRIKTCVMAVATFMIVASMVLVGASLSMSDHIDEMGMYSIMALFKQGQNIYVCCSGRERQGGTMMLQEVNLHCNLK